MRISSRTKLVTSESRDICTTRFFYHHHHRDTPYLRQLHLSFKEYIFGPLILRPSSSAAQVQKENHCRWEVHSSIGQISSVRFVARPFECNFILVSPVLRVALTQVFSLSQNEDEGPAFHQPEIYTPLT